MKACTAIVLLLYTSILVVQSKRVYKTALLAIQGLDTAWSQWNATFNEFFNERLGNEERSFVFEPYKFVGITDGARNGDFDFVMVQPMLWSCFTQELGYSPVATLVKDRQGTVLNQFGGQIITRADRDDINTMADLNDKVIAAVSLLGFGAGQLQWFEMAKAGLSPFSSPKKVMLAYSQKKIVRDVLSGAADVGFVRTDMVAGMLKNGEIEDIGAFKLINEIPDESFPFPRSTPLYNEWSFGASPTVPEDLQREVALALWSITPNSIYAKKGKYHHFQPPQSYNDEINLQSILGVMRTDPVSLKLSCAIDEDLYTMLSCGTGSFKLSREEVESGCDSCPEGYDCLCTPCRRGIPEEVLVTVLDVNGENSTQLCHAMKHCGSTYVRDHYFDVLLVDNRGNLRASGGARWKLIYGDGGIDHVVASGILNFASGQTSVGFRVQVPALPASFFIQITSQSTYHDLLTSPILLSTIPNPEPLLVHPAILGLVGLVSLLALIVVLRSLFVDRLVQFPLTPVQSVILLHCIGVLLLATSAVLTSLGYCAGAIISLVFGFHASLSPKLVLSHELVSLIHTIRIERKVITNMRVMQLLSLVALPDMILLASFLVLVPLDHASQMDPNADALLVNIETHCHVAAGNSNIAQGILACFLFTKLVQGVLLRLLPRRFSSVPKRFNNVRTQNTQHWTFVAVLVLIVVFVAVTGELVGVSQRLSFIAALLVVDTLMATFFLYKDVGFGKPKTGQPTKGSSPRHSIRRRTAGAQLGNSNSTSEVSEPEGDELSDTAKEELLLKRLSNVTRERDALVKQLGVAKSNVANFEYLLFKFRHKNLYEGS